MSMSLCFNSPLRYRRLRFSWAEEGARKEITCKIFDFYSSLEGNSWLGGELAMDWLVAINIYHPLHLLLPITYYLFVCLSICPSVRLSIRLSACLSACLAYIFISADAGVTLTPIAVTAAAAAVAAAVAAEVSKWEKERKKKEENNSVYLVFPSKSLVFGLSIL